MPFATGTAATPSILLKAINDHLVANGWTKIRGEADMNVASPKAARYWRLLCLDNQGNTSTYGIQKLHLRTTVGGANVAMTAANWSVSSIGTGSTSLLISGGIVRSTNLGTTTAKWTLTYDFGSATTIREIEIQADSTVGNTPNLFLVQWSNDGLTWTTMNQVAAATWTASATRQYAFGDGFLHTRHVSSTQPRRSGKREDTFDSNTYSATNGYRDMSEDYWIWQGPGYDAARRVYIHARGHCAEGSDTHTIEFGYSADYDGAIVTWGQQEGDPGVYRAILMNSSVVNYWIYSNDIRMILVVRSGAQDYTSVYAGFMAAFGTPDQWPFPLCVSAMAPTDVAYIYGDSNNVLSSCADPGVNCGICRLWDGTNEPFGNRQVSGSTNLYAQTPSRAWVHPYHFGGAGNGNWPRSMCGHNSTYGGHFFDRVNPSQQNHLPLFPCTVQHTDYGNIAVLEGVFAVPSGSVLTALQVLTIDGQDYRVFPNRTRRDGVNWMAIRED